MNKFLQLMIVVCASLAMLGCMTMKPLGADAAQLRGTLKPGDHVELVTAGGQKMQLKIDSVDEKGLQGDGQHVAYSDIRSISRKQVAVGSTTLLVLGIVAAGAVAAGGGGGGGSGGY